MLVLKNESPEVILEHEPILGAEDRLTRIFEFLLLDTREEKDLVNQKEMV